MEINRQSSLPVGQYKTKVNGRERVDQNGNCTLGLSQKPWRCSDCDGTAGASAAVVLVVLALEAVANPSLRLRRGKRPAAYIYIYK